MPLRRPGSPSCLLRNLLFGLLSFSFSAAAVGAAAPRPAPDEPVPGASSRLSWALAPGVLPRLSPGAQEAVRVANSLARPPAAASRAPRAAARAPQAAPTPRQNVRVSDPVLQGELVATRTTSVAAHGSQVFVAFDDSTYAAAGYGVSSDGGATYVHGRIPAPANTGYYGSPSAAIGPNGEIYYAFLSAAAGDPTSISLAKSTDGGATFPSITDASAPVENGFDVMDRPSVAVDTGASSPRKGRIFVAWTYYFSTYGYTAILCSYSNDGSSFTYPAILSGGGVVDGVAVDRARVAVAPNGDVYVAWEDHHLSPDGVAVARSKDGGVTWSVNAGAKFQSPGALTAGGGGAPSDTGPSIAVDGNGVVHLAWSAVATAQGADRSDVWYARATDGATWSAAKKLNDDGSPTSQGFAAVAALPDGSVAVRWADRRNDPSNDAATDVFMAISRDGGATWGKNFRVTDRSAPWGPVPHFLGGYGHASYEGIAGDGGTFWVAWTDERSGVPEIWSAAVPETFDANAPDFGLAASSTYAAIPQGGSAAFDVSVTAANGFTGAAALVPDVAPAGLSLSLSAGSASPGTPVRLTVTASASAAPGDYVVGVAASAGGLTRGTRVRVTVTDASRGFGPALVAAATPGFTEGAVKPDSSGVLHAVYDDDSGYVTDWEVFYRRSTDGGATFSSPVRLHASGSRGGESAFTIDATGRIYVVWSGQTMADPSPRIYFARSTDGGTTFSAPLAINGTTGYAVHPNVASDANGNLVVAWYDLSGNAPVVGWSRSTNAGTSFSTPVAVDDGPALIARPAVAVDSKNDAWIAWTQQSYPGGVFASVVRAASSKTGGTFSAPGTVSDASLFAYAPDLAAGPDDSVGLAYYVRSVVNNAATNRQIAFTRSTDAGKTFPAPVLVSSAAQQAYAATVAFEASGAIDVAWEAFGVADLQSDVFVARSTDGGATFSPALNVSTDGGFSGSSAAPVGLGGPGRPAVTAAPSGALVVSYADDSGGKADLFFTTLPAARVSNRPPVAVITAPAPGSAFEAGVPVAFTGTGTDPEGQAVTLSWDFGDGRGASGPSVSHPFAVPGTYAVTLSARDAGGATGTASISVTITAPTASVSDTSLLVPVVLEAAGVGGSRYTSEVTLVSRSAQPVDVVLAYTASVGSGSGFAHVTLAPGEMRVQSGFLGWLRSQGLPIPSDGTTQVGTLVATFRGVARDLAFAGARTYTPDPGGSGGTFGLFAPAAGTTSSSAFLFGLQQNASQRSNVAVVNAGGSPIVLRVALQGPNGEDLGALPDLALGPWGWAQLNQPLSGKAESGRAVVTRVSGSSSFSAYAVLNDAVTSDGSFLAPVLGDDGTGADLLVPIVLDVAGLGARFRTELTLVNRTASPLPITLDYVAAPGLGSGSGSVALTLAAGEQRIVPDAIAFLRGTLPIESDGRNVGGTLRVRAASGTPASALAAGARTFVPLSPSGSYGLFYGGLTPGQSATSTAWIYGLQENGAQRSNLAILNRGDAGDTIVLRVTYYGANGAALGAPVDRALGAGEWAQYGRPLLALGVPAGYAKVEKLSGASKFAAYGVLNDNVTSDGSYIAMTVPQP